MEDVVRMTNKPESTFWAGKKVMVTGHTGFKGSWLCVWLHSLGAKVSGISLEPDSSPSLFNLIRGHEITYSKFSDIRDKASLDLIFSEIQPEIVFHMAAQPLVRKSYSEPLNTLSTNVIGTANVFEAARFTGSVRAIVNITTDKCYKNKEWIWGYREDEALGGHDPYSASKACAEILSEAYRRSFLATEEIFLATVRAGNVIGGGDWAEDRLIPDVLRAHQAGKELSIRYPSAIRPWQHVLEPLSGYLELAQKLFETGAEYAEAWNFGPNDEDAKSVEDVVAYLLAHLQNEKPWQIASGRQPHEAHYLKLDISKALSRLNWKPKWPLETALDSIIEWHEAYFLDKDMFSICHEQISRYEND